MTDLTTSVARALCHDEPSREQFLALYVMSLRIFKALGRKRLGKMKASEPGYSDGQEIDRGFDPSV